jgi:hypothetical protein
MSCPLAKTPLAPVRAGCEWVVVEMGDTSGIFWAASAVFDKSGALVCGGLELGWDVDSASCCIVMGIGATLDDRTGASGGWGDGVASGRDAVASGRAGNCSRGSTETLTGSFAGVIDADVERAGTNAGAFGTGAEFMESVQP